ncbi:TetR/AcrR family transcriptional regulator [Clostridium botulinum C]|uniref:TetR/AcrR family transcriptional regulator n=3 Tax=Clostridium botulinum TaxID=1491 RepID=A0A9Q4TNM3_CLOBO|nr:TetR/AcrR family transcriptional regulator [Clostridium botulinum]EGO88026.1 transcriptional regulator [Clostridium botulinum C str. Stockholm]MCD3193790.1 TetR/AcrR family transcriptional regulator [Clostridium botulinum C]MCD3199858.1 TetR/AcrR family transcriptional regulator [Clostridium botulinum C]MCD3205333.1 TetR/AcrR family transcriptional regulator [Clostridium botulinum C]MCD3207259.1 TetR/AcrR family transcriptional regulator [Clostridium botulinum C]
MPKILENVKDTILKESKKILLKENYKALNIRQIAKCCNIGIGTFYNYFSTKDELVIEILKNDFDKIMDLIEQLKNSNLSFKEKLEQIYKSFDLFLGNYISVFYEISSVKGMNCKPNADFSNLYKCLGELIDIEKTKGTMKKDVNSYDFAHFIVSNLFYLTKTHYISFEQLYSFLNI